MPSVYRAPGHAVAPRAGCRPLATANLGARIPATGWLATYTYVELTLLTYMYCGRP